MPTAFVLSGGGSLGAVQVGMLQALADHGVSPDLLVGTSAGALNAAYLAFHGTGRASREQLAAHWIGTRRAEVFPIDVPRHLLALRGVRPSLFTGRGLHQLISRQLDGARLENAPLPVHLIATDLLTGAEVVLSDGDAASAVQASAAIPGMLPPVTRDGRTLVDGGLADNAAISVAVARGADRVFVLPTGYPCALTQPPASALGVAVHALSLLVQQRLIADVAYFAERVELHVVPPLCPLSVSSIDFRQARRLIERAGASSARWLEAGGLDRPHPERLLALHGHTGSDPASDPGCADAAVPVSAWRGDRAGPAG